jgi:hypothetical protein
MPQLSHFCKPMVRLNCCTRFQECAEREHVELAPIELHHGDFLTSAAVKEAISSAGLVYMNNPLFGATLNLKVLRESLSRPSPSRKEFLCSMAKQLSSDQLCPLMPKGCKLVLQPSFQIIKFQFDIDICLQICFDSLIDTRGHSRQPHNELLAYKKLIEVSLYTPALDILTTCRLMQKMIT